MSSKNLNQFKDFQSDQIQRSSRKIFTAHYACRNATLNFTPVTGMTNGFIFQIINSLIESWGVRLTCFDSKVKFSLMYLGIFPVGNAGRDFPLLLFFHSYLKELQRNNYSSLSNVFSNQLLQISLVFVSYTCLFKTVLMLRILQ